MNSLPCPFCGSHAIEVLETSTYRWCACHCCACGAIGPEIRLTRLKYGPDDPWLPEDYAAAVAEWNRRAAT